MIVVSQRAFFILMQMRMASVFLSHCKQTNKILRVCCLVLLNIILFDHACFPADENAEGGDTKIKRHTVNLHTPSHFTSFHLHYLGVLHVLQRLHPQADDNIEILTKISSLWRSRISAATFVRDVTPNPGKFDLLLRRHGK